MDEQHHPRTMGVFKPTGHVVMVLPSAEDADDLVDDLVHAGLAGEEVTRYDPQQMQQQAAMDLQAASPLAHFGQELNLLKTYAELAGQGAHFILDIHEEADLAVFMAAYLGTTAVTCLDGSTPLFSAHWQGPLAWVFGAEGQGVRPELIAAAGLRVRIPMPGAVESLNVGAAAAVCLFEMVRRRA